jgi:integron integrase
MNREAALKRFVEVMRVLRRSRKTIEAYTKWVSLYIDSLAVSSPGDTREQKIGRFLTRLVIKQRVSASTQKQALCAIVRFYKWVVREEVGELDFARSEKPVRLPAVFSVEEVWSVLDRLQGQAWLWGGIMYGSGLRLEECCQLRVKDVDIDRRQITVREGKGNKDRVVPLAEMLVEPLRNHLRWIRTVYEGYAARRVAVSLPDALDRKYPNAPFSWEWFWLFPASGPVEERPERPVKDKSWIGKLYHIHHSAVQKRIKAAIIDAQVPKKASCHTFRHSFATHWLENAEGCQEAALFRLKRLMGHKKLETTMIYVHLVKLKSDVPSPLDMRPRLEVVRKAA